MVGLLAAGLVGVAVPAQAENHTRNVYICDASGTGGFEPQSITANPGDTIKVWNNCDNRGGGSAVAETMTNTNTAVWSIPDGTTWPVGTSVPGVAGQVGTSIEFLCSRSQEGMQSLKSR